MTAPLLDFPKLGMTRAEVALSVGISPTTLDAYIAEGVLPPPRRVGKRNFWLVREIEAAMLDWPIDGKQEASPSGWVIDG
jgi:predicted DNA-binding transcriptional regulator AlpA